MVAPRFLLDTNILSYAIKDPKGSVNHHLQSLSGADICTSIIVACELRYGVAKKGSRQLADKVESILNNIRVLPLDEDVSQHYADIRYQLEKEGKVIGQNDLLIAAHARSGDMTVVTNNEREFARVRGLKVENWLR